MVPPPSGGPPPFPVGAQHRAGLGGAGYPTPVSTAIDIQELAKEYPAIGRAGVTRAVDRVSLRIESGELFFLLGPSGCGKTTLLRMIAGFIDPTAGSIAFNGRDVTRTPPNKRNTGMVFQSYALWPHMTVAQNVAFGLGVRKVPGEEKQRRVGEALAQVRMAEYGGRRPTQLSGGQQQRVALARALVVRPDVLLLDEPLSNLDAKLRLELRSEIRRVCKDSGLTTVYVTHDQKEALSMADRVAIMDAGRVIQIGTPRELYRRPNSRFVAEFLGEADFLEARVGARHEGVVALETPAGPLTAAAGENPPTAGSTITICVRPESWRLGPAQEGSAATLIDTIFLGEMAQHTLELPNHVRIRASVINPAAHGALPPGGRVGLAASPEDVILLPNA
ncbi:MAG: ABC transporter ATP-binding protein [Phycisphaerales bacterium]|nr:ABC transporter ATP-binding protein [Phycisphaerales bacterium]